VADKAVQSPLQLFGLYLAWAETALSASVWATASADHWTRHLLMTAMAVGLLAYVGIAGFLLIYLVVKRPAFLFNPSDFDKSVQHLLFGPGAPQLEVANPPAAPAPGAAPEAPAGGAG
jgi:hypothetical protein